MKNIRTALALTATALGLASTAQAGFVNGGFETGNLTGWTLENGINTVGSAGAIPFSVVSNIPDPSRHAYMIGTGNASGFDPYSPFDNAFSGNYMVRLNEYGTPNSFNSGGRHATRLSQSARMASGETDLYINWGAVLEDPAGHSAAEEPFFRISVKVNGVEVAGSPEVHISSDPGWIAGPAIGPNGSQTYYSQGVYHISGLVTGDGITTGDLVTVSLTVADCSLSGHAGWAYLDGIGSTVTTPPPGVPDGALTAFLLAPAFLGLAAFRRRR